MNKLNIDFISLLPYVIDAYSHVYGDEYRSTISKKINHTIIISYNDYEGIRDYAFYLDKCKSRELSIRFLEEIGITDIKYDKDNYNKPFDRQTEEILDCLIDSSLGFSEVTDYWSPLLAFDSNNNSDPKRLLLNRIKIINFLLGSDHEKITEDDIDSFIETEEFSQLLGKIKEYKTVYEKLLDEYKEWKKQLDPYKKYAKDEEERKKGILQERKDYFFMEILYKLPTAVRESISGKGYEEKKEIILGSCEISSKFDFESFSSQNMEELKSPDVNHWKKYWIVYSQSNYLKRLGVTFPDEKMLECATEEDVANYLSFLNQDDVKKFIPSEDTISYISSTRERMYELALIEYYTTRKDFLDIFKVFPNTEDNLRFVYHQIKDKNVCVNNYDDLLSIMFYTVRLNDGGLLFNNFLHECGHVIDGARAKSGFERLDNECIDRNPYDSNFRKYEKFNETLTDMFTLEALDFLHSQGIYLIEQKELTKLDTSNVNTAAITKELLQPLLQKYRNYVIKAKINSDPQELIKYIGEDNFEDLVDAVNKVDLLSRNGVLYDIDKNPEDPMVIDYFGQVERVKQIYTNIDNYYTSNFGGLPSDDFGSTPKTR